MRLLKIFFILLIFSNHVYAVNQATIFPNRVIIENKKSSEVTLVNQSDHTVLCNLKIFDLTMTPKGELMRPSDTTKNIYSLDKYIRLSPRTISLKKGERQKIRVKLKTPTEYVPGELHSHITVTTQPLPEDYKAALKEAKRQGLGFAAGVNVNTYIPIFARFGKTYYTLTVDNVSVRTNDIDVVLRRKGNMSPYGKLEAHFVKDDQDHLLGKSGYIAIYREVDTRDVNIKVNKPSELKKLSNGTLLIYFIDKEKPKKKIKIYEKSM
ncbi:MAG: hypothetical protein HRU36_03205 [Rickettsiales bacterium]|nr:hypothetical protein [Rickettsiales bacterium]